MYCVKFLDPLRGKFGFLRPRIRFRQPAFECSYGESRGYGVTGYADGTDENRDFKPPMNTNSHDLR